MNAHLGWALRIWGVSSLGVQLVCLAPLNWNMNLPGGVSSLLETRKYCMEKCDLYVISRQLQHPSALQCLGGRGVTAIEMAVSCRCLIYATHYRPKLLYKYWWKHLSFGRVTHLLFFCGIGNSVCFTQCHKISHKKDFRHSDNQNLCCKIYDASETAVTLNHLTTPLVKPVVGLLSCEGKLMLLRRPRFSSGEQERSGIKRWLICSQSLSHLVATP